MVIKAPKANERRRVRAPRAAAQHRPVARRRPAPDRHRAARRPARPGRLALYRACARRPGSARTRACSTPSWRPPTSCAAPPPRRGGSTPRSARRPSARSDARRRGGRPNWPVAHRAFRAFATPRRLEQSVRRLSPAAPCRPMSASAPLGAGSAAPLRRRRAADGSARARSALVAAGRLARRERLARRGRRRRRSATRATRGARRRPARFRRRAGRRPHRRRRRMRSTGSPSTRSLHELWHCRDEVFSLVACVTTRPSRRPPGRARPHFPSRSRRALARSQRAARAGSPALSAGRAAARRGSRSCRARRRCGAAARTPS